MTLTFSESSEYFNGFCQDEESDLGFSDIKGRWFQSNGLVNIEFDKHYRDKHHVDYKGKITENFTKIEGDYFGGSAPFTLLYQPESERTAIEPKSMAGATGNKSSTDKRWEFSNMTNI